MFSFQKVVTLLKTCQFRKNIGYARNFPRETADYPFEEKYVEIDGHKICYIAEGKGHPVILLHGSLDGIGLWIKNIPSLSEHFRVYALDFPGFGKSDRNVNEISVDYLTRILKAFIEKLSISKPHIIGSSLGGRVALEYSIRNNECGRLVLSAPAGIASRPKGFLAWGFKLFNPSLMSAILYRYTFKIIWDLQFYQPTAESDEASKLCLFYHQVPNAAERLRFVRAFVRSIQSVVMDPINDRLNEVMQPVFLIWGDHDYYHPMTFGIQAARQIKNTRFHVIRNAGHYANLERFEDFNRLAIEFLIETK